MKPADGISIAAAGWLTAPEVRRVLALLGGKQSDPLSLFVGGCVRNTLLGCPIDDVDIATRLLPDEVMARGKEAGLSVIPTGLQHGTVMLVAGGQSFEVTTLRIDVETDGRHADIEFTQDWQADAARRDFTVNALYADLSGRVFDPVGGLPDIKDGRIRFVGQAETRIAEDYLRILRLFRFHAWYGAGAMDETSLRASAGGVHGLAQISAERIWKELNKMLGAPKPGDALSQMIDTGVMAAILPGATRLDTLMRLVRLEELLSAAPIALVRLAALFDRPSADGSKIAGQLKFSNKEASFFKALFKEIPELSEDMTPFALDLALYRFGRDTVCGQLMLAGSATNADVARFAGLMKTACNRAIPEFPIAGKDLLDLGIEPGKQIGELLKDLENMWIDARFRLGADDLLAAARKRPRPR